MGRRRTNSLARLFSWLRSGRGLVALFLLVTILPAATLVVLAVRLMDQERLLAEQRRGESLDHAADQAVRLLGQRLTLLGDQLARGGWKAEQLAADSAQVVFRDGHSESVPLGAIPFLPVAGSLKEIPEVPFTEIESYEFTQQNLTKALELSHRMVSSGKADVRAGALLREARLLRKLGRTEEAFESYIRISDIREVELPNDQGLT